MGAMAMNGATGVFPLLALWLASASDIAHASSPNDPTDKIPPAAREFLVPSVCLGPQGAPIAADPYACPGKSRKLRFGELLPYRRYNENYSQAGDSFLRPFGDDDVPRIVSLFDARGNAVDPLHHEGAFGAYDAINDGFDVAAVSGSSVSGIGTKVSKGLNLFLNGECQLKNSWFLFDSSKVRSNTIDRDPQGQPEIPLISFFDPFDASPADRTSTELISDRNWGLVGAGGCPAHPIAPLQKSESDAVWVYFPSFTYGARDSSGRPKNMTTLASAHYQLLKEPLGQGRYREHMGHTEIVYYTVTYSRIRWESWNNASYVPNTNTETELPEKETCNGKREYVDRNGDRMVRNRCQEWSNVVPAQYGGYDPRAWPGQKDLFFGNLLVNGDFSGGCPPRIARSDDSSRCNVPGPNGLPVGAAPVFSEQSIAYAAKSGELTRAGIRARLAGWDDRGRWKLRPGLRAGLVWGEPSDPAQARWEFRKFHMRIEIEGGSSDNLAFYQDVPVVATPIPPTPAGSWGPTMQRYARIGPGSPVSFGGVFWASEPAQATLNLEELDAKGSVLRTNALPLKLTTTPQHFSAETVAEKPDAVELRFAFVPAGHSASFSLDQLFLVREKRD
jgi:hypothetical protein